MRVPVKGPDKPVTYLWERHKEIARRVLCGQKPIEICRELGYTPAWLSTIMNSPVFIQYLASLRERTEEGVTDVRKRLAEGAETGVMKLLDILQSDQTSPSLQAKVAMDFLDRAGFPKVTRSEVNERKEIILTDERIEQIKANRAQKLAALRQTITIS